MMLADAVQGAPPWWQVIVLSGVSGAVVGGPVSVWLSHRFETKRQERTWAREDEKSRLQEERVARDLKRERASALANWFVRLQSARDDLTSSLAGDAGLVVANIHSIWERWKDLRPEIDTLRPRTVALPIMRVYSALQHVENNVPLRPKVEPDEQDRPLGEATVKTIDYALTELASRLGPLLAELPDRDGADKAPERRDTEDRRGASEASG